MLSLLLQALEAAEAVHSQLEALLERERSDNRGMAADAAEMQVGGSADVVVKSSNAVLWPGVFILHCCSSCLLSLHADKMLFVPCRRRWQAWSSSWRQHTSSWQRWAGKLFSCG